MRSTWRRSNATPPSTSYDVGCGPPGSSWRATAVSTRSLVRTSPAIRLGLGPPPTNGWATTLSPAFSGAEVPPCPPGSVAARRYRPGRWRPFILDRCCQQPHATYPLTRASSLQAPAVRSCSGRGLPSRDGHPPRWWALTPPFHPYPPVSDGRSALCGTVPRVTPGGR